MRLTLDVHIISSGAPADKRRWVDRRTTDLSDISSTPEHHVVMKQYKEGKPLRTTSHQLRDPETKAELNYKVLHYEATPEHPHSRIAEVEMFRTPRKNRGHGGAQRLGEQFHQFVDKENMPVVAEALPLDHWARSNTQFQAKRDALMQAYGTRGYRKVGNQGEMVRLPGGVRGASIGPKKTAPVSEHQRIARIVEATDGFGENLTFRHPPTNTQADVEKFPTHLYIRQINTPTKSQRQGGGHEVMKQITQAADKHQLPAVLWGSGAHRKFYEAHGFHAEAPDGRGMMVRLPKAQTTDRTDITATPEHVRAFRQFNANHFSDDYTDHTLHDPETGGKLFYSVHHMERGNHPKIAKVRLLVVPRSKRGQGGIQRLGRQLHEHLDREQIPAVAYVEPIDPTRTTSHSERRKEALMQMYGSQGYKKVGVEGHMVRLPKAQT